MLDKHGPVIKPRLDEALPAQLKADIATMKGVSPGALLGEQKTATASEREIAADAHDLLMLIRNAVRRSPNATAELRQALGVGEDLSEENTRAILDALAAVAAHSEALGACRVAPEDIAEAASLATRLQAADTAQKGAILARTGSTEDRVDVQLRLEGFVDAVHVVGMLAFRKQPAVRARFDELVSSTGPRHDDDGEGGGGDAGGPTS